MMSRQQVFQLVIAVILVVSFLVGCGGSTWDGGEFAGQPVYDLSNKRFSTAAMDVLKTCGLSDNDIRMLAEQSIPGIKEVSGSISNISDVTFADAGTREDIATFSLKELKPEIFEITCTSLR